jgi:CO dehydrogenase maturation factor
LNIGVGNSYVVINQSKEAPSGMALKMINDGGIELIGTVPEDRTIYDFDFNGRPTIEMPEDSVSVQAAFGIFDKIVA